MAEAVAQTLARRAGLALRLEFDSAATNSLQGRAFIDPQARAALTRAGYRARRVTSQDITPSDLVLAMDAGHLEALRKAYGEEHDVPDPYFGDLGGFDRVLALCEAGVRGLLAAAPGLFDDAGPDGLRDPCAG